MAKRKLNLVVKLSVNYDDYTKMMDSLMVEEGRLAHLVDKAPMGVQWAQHDKAQLEAVQALRSAIIQANNARIRRNLDRKQKAAAKQSATGGRIVCKNQLMKEDDQ